MKRSRLPVYLIFVLLLFAVCITTTLCLPIFAQETTISLADLAAPLTIDAAGTYRLVGSTTHPVTVTADTTLILDGVTMTADAASPLAVSDGVTVSLLLYGENTLLADATGFAGLAVAKTASLSVLAESTGSLTATGGHTAPGIGGGMITISGGTIYANGGILAAGIGGAFREAATAVTITGGTIYANGNLEAPGIGSGASAETETPIVITGGSIYAIGGEDATRDMDSTAGLVNVKLTDFVAGTPASKVVLSDSTYGGGMHAAADGTFSLWIPAEQTVRRLLSDDTTYLFDLAAGVGGKAVYVTTDTVLDLAEGEVFISGNTYTQGAITDTAEGITITGTPRADATLCIADANVTLYRIVMPNAVYLSGNTTLSLQGTSTFSAPLTVAADSTVMLCGDTATITTTGDAITAENATVLLDGATLSISTDATAIAAETCTINSGALTITAKTGVSADTLTVNGGTLTLTATETALGKAGATIGLHGGQIHANATIGGADAALTVTGGTIVAPTLVGRVIIAGGSLFATPDTQPQNAVGVPLLATFVKGIARDKQVTAVTTASATLYGTKDMFANAEGILCLWLAAGDVVQTVSNATTTHRGTVSAGEVGYCTAACVTLPMGHVSIDAYGYRVGEVYTEHSGAYLLADSGTVSVTFSGVSTRLTLQNTVLLGSGAPVLSLTDGSVLELVLVGENRMTMQSAHAPIVVADTARMTITSEKTGASLIAVGGANTPAICGTGSVLQTATTCRLTGGTASAATDVSYTISGGTIVLTDGAGAENASRKLTITGGTAILPPDSVGVTDASGRALLATTVTGLPAGTPITSISYQPYGLVDVCTDRDGHLVLWLPTDAVLTTLTGGATDITYKCNLRAGETGVARIYYAVQSYTDAAGNRVTADVTEAHAGQTVTLTIIAGENQKAAGVPVVRVDGVDYPATGQGTQYIFVMPQGAVSVSCAFKEIRITIATATEKHVDTMTVDADQTLVVEGTLTVTDLTLSGMGKIEIFGTLLIEGKMQSYGTITNDGELVIAAGATLQNVGTLKNNGTLQNDGTIDMAFGSTLQNEGDYTGDGVLRGEGRATGIGMPLWLTLLLVIGGIFAVGIGVTVWLVLRYRKKLAVMETLDETL